MRKDWQASTTPRFARRTPQVLRRAAPPPWLASLARLCRKFFDSWQGMPLCELESSGIAVHVRYCGVNTVNYVSQYRILECLSKKYNFPFKTIKKVFFYFWFKNIKKGFLYRKKSLKTVNFITQIKQIALTKVHN